MNIGGKKEQTGLDRGCQDISGKVIIGLQYLFTLDNK